MGISLLTNLNSLTALENLRTNGEFQSRTMLRLSSGYRINSAGDDPAGAAIANQFRQSTAELTQGVSNANNGIGTLQIIDGGMNNIAQILDRLKVLATQSASDTFSGDRNALNSEFQTLLTEINRQAQAIGLDQGGQFANLLSIHVGGAAAVASVNVDLSASSVDTRSLGLGIPGAKGMLVTASPGGSVPQILADIKNTTATPGYTDFYLAGPGFSDGSTVKVSANLQGVSDLNSLAASINSAIQVAANGVTQAAAALKSSGITASVYADAAGGRELSFGSSTTAFQVEAGDQMSNALMGNLVVANGVIGSTGTPLATTVAGQPPAAGLTTAKVTVRFTGAGLAGPVDITLNAGSSTADLQTQVSNNAQLSGAGISAAAALGGSLTFTGSHGEKFSVQATGDIGNALGLGTFVSGAAGAVDYTSANGAYAGSVAYGQARLEFSINGAASITVPPIDLSAGNATAATTAPGSAGALVVNPLDTLQFIVDGAPRTMTFALGATSAADAMTKINGAGLGVTASLDSTGHLLLASNTKGANSSIEIAPSVAAGELGLVPVNTIHLGTSQPGSDIANQLNADFQANPALQAAGLTASFSAGTGTLTISSNNNTFFRINPGGSDPAADLGFGVTGQPFSSTLTAASALDQPFDSSGAANIAPLAFSAMAYGSDDQSLTISAQDSSGTVQTKIITLRNDAQGRQGRSIDEAIAYINTQLQNNGLPLQNIVAVKEDVGGAERINFLSSLPSFTVNVDTSANGNGVNGGAAISLASSLAGGGRSLAIDTQAGAVQAVAATAAAVGALGTAQAVVGKGETQLGYALGLAQSQITNTSAAESGIRDADVAAEAANLTKSQVLQQAAIAVMAQANTSAQAVLALLKG